MTTPLHELTASEAARLVQTKKISALELAKACAAQIKKLEPKLKAWSYFSEELFLANAKRLDEKYSKETPGKLAGVPVGIKDIFNTSDMPTEMGSPIWKGFTPGNDARVVFYLKMAGALAAGKTVTAEFAVHAPGPTINPLDAGRITGTSSSGSAVAVAANMAPCAIGTQTAGSVIRPASYCGVYGYKPSFGLLPRTGMLKTTDSLDTIGYFARSAEDLALILDVMRVHGLDYPISHARMNDARWQEKAGSRWKVAVVETPVKSFEEKYAQEALAAFAESLAADKEFEIVKEKLPADFERAHAVHESIYDKSLAYYFKNEFKEKTLISREIKEMIERGNKVTLDEFRGAIAAQNKLSHQLDDLLSRYDAFLVLSTAGEAPKLGMEEKKDSCLIWTLCGVPAANLPLLKGPSGLPVGVQLVSRRYSDIKLLKLAKLLSEKSAPQLIGERK